MTTTTRGYGRNYAPSAMTELSVDKMMSRGKDAFLCGMLVLVSTVTGVEENEGEKVFLKIMRRKYF